MRRFVEIDTDGRVINRLDIVRDGAVDFGEGEDVIPERMFEVTDLSEPRGGWERHRYTSADRRMDVPDPADFERAPDPEAQPDPIMERLKAVEAEQDTIKALLQRIAEKVGA